MPLPQWIIDTVAARKQQLRVLMDEYDIEPNSDYDYAHLYAIVDDEDAGCGRYVAITRDETYTNLDVADGLELALDILADAVGQEYLDEPVGVYDLNDKTLIPVKTQVKVIVDEDALRLRHPGA